MSVGPLGGILGSAAGAPLSQTAGSESERARKESSASQRQADGDQKAESAAGIGQTEEDQGASERDADGRSFWKTSDEKKEEQAHKEPQPERKAKDPTGNSGNSLDLTG